MDAPNAARANRKHRRRRQPEVTPVYRGDDADRALTQIERVEYDGQAGNVSITFRPSGVKTLAAELRGADTACARD